jgi:F-type H+-transporting ATPase subunit epsilon
MSEKLHFSLVSPERELYSGEVDQVDAPGSEGDFGVLAGHAPFMTFEVYGGFADVTPAGLTILAEKASEVV